jgi:UDP-N-acetylglucosamine 2-epimerase (non-hydrolysing)
MKVMSVVGARPNFMKVAPIVTAIRQWNAQREPFAIRHVLVHTGQHYDRQMSDSFFSDLNLPAPDVYLGVGSGSHAAQTASIMSKFEPVLLGERPDVVIVVGDVNSTVACALVAAKAEFGATANRPLIAHVEAGLRSFDRTMPEEINRILTDHLADLLFVTEPSGVQNLALEGIPPAQVHFVGNTMIDSLLAFREKAAESAVLRRLGLRDEDGLLSRYGLLTLHRGVNVDQRDNLLRILDGLEELQRQMAVVFPAHPRTQKKIREFGIENRFDWSWMASESAAGKCPAPGIYITEPSAYLDFVQLMSHAGIVVTDSGGIQEETTCLGVPCVTVRDNTERPVTITHGTNTLAGVGTDGIRKTIHGKLDPRPLPDPPEKWDGRSAMRIVEILTNLGIGNRCEPAEPETIGSMADSDEPQALVG